MKITDLQVNKKIITNLTELGYEDLTEIQEQIIEPMLNNQNILAQAQTGSGKTAAFLVPIIHKISNNRNLKALIVAPTRDLANQIYDNAIKYAKGVGVRCANFFGGSSYSRQIRFLEAGIDLAIGTPGRLLDLYDRKKLNLQDINYLVLDEADQMLDMGFIDDIRKIVKATGQLDQMSLFSATIPKEIMRFVTELMPEHLSFRVDSKISVNDVIKQTVYMVDSKNKPKLLVDILGDSTRTKQQAIVFSRTRNEASNIASYLDSCGFRVEALHSDRSQSSRTRALKDFRDNRVQVLVATNVAARGIDINDLPLVINYNLPENKETYVHRIGRTGRVGKKGEAISFMTKNDGALIRDIERLIDMKIEVIDKQEYAVADKDATVIIRESTIKRGGGGGSRDGSRSRSGFGGGSRDGSFRPRREGGSFNRSERGGFGGRSSFGPRKDYGPRKEYDPRKEGEEGAPTTEGFSRPEGSFNREGGFKREGSFNRSERTSSYRGSGERSSYRGNSDRSSSFGGSGERSSYRGNSDRSSSYRGGSSEGSSFDKKPGGFGGERRSSSRFSRDDKGGGKSFDRDTKFGERKFDRPRKEYDGSSSYKGDSTKHSPREFAKTTTPRKPSTRTKKPIEE